MKKSVLWVAVLLGLSATPALAVGPYVGASGGVAIVHDSNVSITGLGSLTASYDTGGGFNVFVGNSFGNGRLEGEFGYKTAGIDKFSGPGGSGSIRDSDINIKSFMVNGYYDFNTTSGITPFVGVGLGLLNEEIKLAGEKEDDTLFGYQVTVGMGMPVDHNFSVDISYRYQGAGSDFSRDGVSFSYDSSNLLVGVRYNF